MTHIKNWLERKFDQSKHIARKHYEYPMFLTWIFIFLGFVFVIQGDIIKGTICVTFSLFYYAYCDYMTGEDIGWKRQQYKDKARTESNARQSSDNRQ